LNEDEDDDVEEDVEFVDFLLPVLDVERRFLVVELEENDFENASPTDVSFEIRLLVFFAELNNSFTLFFFLDDEYEEVEDVLLGLFGGVFATGTLGGAVPGEGLCTIVPSGSICISRPSS